MTTQVERRKIGLNSVQKKRFYYISRTWRLNEYVPHSIIPGKREPVCSAL